MSAEIQIQTTTGTTLTSTSPGEGYKVLGQVATSTPQDIKQAVDKARAAQPAWDSLPLKQRIAYVEKLKPIFESNRDKLIHLTSSEMGMPIGLSTGLFDSAIEEIDWLLHNADSALAPVETYRSDSEVNVMLREPYGVMAAIMPWNFPLPNFVGTVIPALLAGNTVVLKYSEEIPLFSQLLQKLCQQAHLRDGIVHFITGDGTVGAQLADQDVDLLSFTGSSATGRKLYAKAAEKFIPIITELGGSSPGIVFANADLDEIVPQVFWQRFSNSGQFCDGLKRLLIERPVYDLFCQKLADFTKNRMVGNPVDADTELGPLVAKRQLDRLEDQIADAREKGATFLTGGARPDRLDGAYYLPTLITDITFDMKVWTEEVFGPALAIVPFDTEEEALALAHDTDYGLSAFLYTKDGERVERLSRQLKAGSISTQNSDYYKPQNAFGGYKASGIGRVGGVAGFHSVTLTKTCARAIG